MASDRRARGGGVIDTLAEANGSVLAAQWGEAAKEHGGDVFGWWPRAEMEVPRVCGGWREWENHPRVYKKYFPPYYFLFYLAKMGSFPSGDRP